MAQSSGLLNPGVVITPSLSYRKLVRFFLPIGTTWMIVGLTHTVTNAVMARLPYPELSLATFTVIVGLTTIISGPLAMVSQTVLSLASDSKSFSLVRRYIWTLASLLFFILLFLGYTPAGPWILTNIMGLQDPQLISFASTSLRISAFMPIAETLRNSHQGLIIGLQKTSFIFKGILVRFLCMSFVFWWALRTQLIAGYLAGSLVWVFGMALEGIFIFLVIIYYYGSPKKAAAKLQPTGQERLTVYHISTFFLPLGLMMTITAILHPVIQAGIARSLFSPIQSLAIYGVAKTLVMTLSGLLHNIHQCSLVYANGTHDPHWFQVRRFCLYIGCIVSLLILFVALTPYGFSFIHGIMGLSKPLAQGVQYTMLAFAPFPMIRAFKESYWGVLMRNRHTPLIALAKTINVLTVTFIVVSLLVFFQIPNFNPAVIGALAFSLGEIMETLVIRRYTLD